MIRFEKVVILGAGESGVSAASLAKRENKDVFVSDFGEIKDQYKTDLKNNNIPFEEKGHDFDKILNADLIVKSPGISDHVEVIQKARALKLQLVSEIEFASWFNSSKLIAVTGSNGKTTTVSLIYHVLKELNQSAALCGNIGPSFARSILEDGNVDYRVLEVSSFQLDNVKFFKPDIGILLNVTADHLDRYNYSMVNYAKAKLNLFNNMDHDDLAILNRQDELTTSLFSNKDVNIQWVNSETIDYVKSNLLGVHNQFNIACAIAALTSLGFNKEKVIKTIASFAPVKHRLEQVAEINSIVFINDSKATNVDSVKFALDGIDEKIIWIAGGVDKGNDYGLIKSLVLEKVKTIICLTTDDSKLRSAFEKDLNMVTFTDTDKAVKYAFDHAEKDDVVLLSPACASFDLFNNYEHRGELFSKAVLNLMN